jgi:hypothetical protein
VISLRKDSYNKQSAIYQQLLCFHFFTSQPYEKRKMERSDEFRRIIEIYASHNENESSTIEKRADPISQQPSASKILCQSVSIYEGIFSNEELIKQLDR